MCGIVGVVSQRNVVPILLDGLHRLEYRGYDSAGVAVIYEQQELQLVKRQGKVKILEQALESQSSCPVGPSGELKGNIGIAHTRWATHGEPCERNAHPHIVGDRIAIVHNGIIENYNEIKRNFLQDFNLISDTDTEIIAACIYKFVFAGNDFLAAVQKTIKLLSGAYAICVLDAKSPERMIVACSGSPLVIGLGIGEYFVASDPLALQKVSQEFIYLEEKDLAEISIDSLTIYNVAGKKTKREVHAKQFAIDTADKGKYRHFMQKEVFEQARAVKSCISGRINQGHIIEQAFGRMAVDIFNKTKQIVIVGCGTSYYAALIACHWLSGIAGIDCRAEIASEFRYRKRVFSPGTLLVTVSQSGETADTIAALRDIVCDPSDTYCGTLAICNVPESTLVRNSDLVLLTHAGPEIGVATTKGFTTQLVGLFLLTLCLGARYNLARDEISGWLGKLAALPGIIDEFLSLNEKIKNLASLFLDKQQALFLGRGLHFPIALEGALKLKELSYIHASAYPAGELKHGPLALVDNDMPVVVMAPPDNLLDKVKSNIQEVQARGGELIVITAKSSNIKPSKRVQVLNVPETPTWLSPIVYVIPLQLLAYHVAVLKGTDVDQPRNLAKSVTVE